MFDIQRDILQRQRSGSADGEVALRTLDPEPINFLAPPGFGWKSRQELFSVCRLGDDAVNQRYLNDTPSIAPLSALGNESVVKSKVRCFRGGKKLIKLSALCGNCIGNMNVSAVRRIHQGFKLTPKFNTIYTRQTKIKRETV